MVTKNDVDTAIEAYAAAWTTGIPQSVVMKATLKAVDKVREEYWHEKVRKGMALEFVDVEQALGKVLGYPWYKDDQKNFPDATEEDGVCVGDHVAGSIAAEAASYITALKTSIEILEKDRRKMVELLKWYGADEELKKLGYLKK